MIYTDFTIASCSVHAFIIKCKILLPSQRTITDNDDNSKEGISPPYFVLLFVSSTLDSSNSFVVFLSIRSTGIQVMLDSPKIPKLISQIYPSCLTFVPPLNFTSLRSSNTPTYRSNSHTVSFSDIYSLVISWADFQVQGVIILWPSFLDFIYQPL